MVKRYILGIIVFGCAISWAGAQNKRDLNQEVKVVKAYQPVVSDAKRIGDLPMIVDTTHFTPSFEYHVHTRPLAGEYTPESIPAAFLVGEPLSKIYGSRLKVAGGNYSTLFGDYRLNNLRSKKWDYGLHLQHYSSNGKLSLENEDKEKATWSQQKAEVSCKRYFKEAEMGGELYFRRQGLRYYGSPNSIGAEYQAVPWGRDTELTGKQNYIQYGVDAQYATRYRDEDRMNYSLGVDYFHFDDKFEVKQDQFQINGEIVKRHESSFWGVDGAVKVINTNGLIYWDDKDAIQSGRKSGFVELKPYYLLRPGRWNIKLGLATYIAIGDDSDLKLYPDMNFEYQAVEHILTLFARLGGELEMNDYQKIVGENPYVYSGLNVENTDHQLHLTGGMKGNFSSQASFGLSAEYSIIKNQYLFVKYDGLSALEKSTLPLEIYANKFGVVYDDMDFMALNADFNLKWNEMLSFEAHLKGFKYSVKEQEKAWHLPGYELNIGARYKYDKKLCFNAGVRSLGKSYALSAGKAKTLDGVFDLRLGAQYQIDKQISAFVHINNVIADKYYRWDGYPMKGFNALGGVSFTF